MSNLKNQCRHKERYHVGINYKQRIVNSKEIKVDGHAITAEKLPSGKIVYYDAQNGEFVNIRENVDIESLEILRVDKLLFNKDVLNRIARAI